MITLILGKRGSGKSTLANNMCKFAENIIILDVFDEYKDFPVCEFPSDFKRFKKCRVLSTSSHADELFFKHVRRERNRIVLIEEVDRFCSPHFIHSDLDHMVRYGRHDNQSLIGISRRPAEIHRHLTANCDEMISFRMREPRDLIYFRAISDDFSREIKNLEKFKFASIRL